MSKCKYKIGDHVVVKESNIESSNKFANRVGVVVDVDLDYPWSYLVRMTTDDQPRVWCKVKGYAMCNDKIIITHDTKTTTATMYKDGKKITATARCAPEDKFDFTVGAKLAVERLEAKVNPPKPKYYNGKVVCVNGDGIDFTAGKVYEIKNGKFIDNDGEERPCCKPDHRVSALTDLTTGYFMNWPCKFIHYVE